MEPILPAVETIDILGPSFQTRTHPVPIDAHGPRATRGSYNKPAQGGHERRPRARQGIRETNAIL